MVWVPDSWGKIIQHPIEPRIFLTNFRWQTKQGTQLLMIERERFGAGVVGWCLCVWGGHSSQLFKEQCPGFVYHKPLLKQWSGKGENTLKRPLSSDQNPRCLLYIGDPTAQVSRDYKTKPLQGSPLNNQYFMESKSFFLSQVNPTLHHLSLPSTLVGFFSWLIFFVSGIPGYRDTAVQAIPHIPKD